VMKKYEEELKKNKELEADAVKLAVERTELQELNERMQEVQNRMQGMYKRMPFEGLDDDTQKRIKGLAILDRAKKKKD
jgi:hypothetical protein